MALYLWNNNITQNIINNTRPQYSHIAKAHGIKGTLSSTMSVWRNNNCCYCCRYSISAFFYRQKVWYNLLVSISGVMEDFKYFYRLHLPGRGGNIRISGTRSCTITITIAVTQVANKKYNIATKVFHGSGSTASLQCRFLLAFAMIWSTFTYHLSEF